MENLPQQTAEKPATQASSPFLDCKKGGYALRNATSPLAAADGTQKESKAASVPAQKQRPLKPISKKINHTVMSSPSDKIQSPTTKQLEAMKKKSKVGGGSGLRGKLLADVFKKEMAAKTAASTTGMQKMELRRKSEDSAQSSTSGDTDTKSEE
ncbi:hypothetical protein MP228_009524 [Amoeboaphelidium protococcarum]|nr:hypothetical protein MP228_009524 [Amoeboaphelidium protococcarum]